MPKPARHRRALPRLHGRTLEKFVLVGAAVLGFWLGPAQAEQALAPATVVVYNSEAPEAVQLAKFYAEKRGIARDHLVPLRCSTEEEISREDYERTIARPLLAIFKKRGWWRTREVDGAEEVTTSSIRFLALIKGMPLKIRPAENHPDKKPGDNPVAQRNEASVDSELTRLPRGVSSIYGAINNPYFKSYRRIMDGEDLPLLLVSRLDGPNAAIVRQMITDAIETEKRGLWGRAFIDRAKNNSPGYELGDVWLGEVVKQLRKAGIPTVEEETTEIFAEGYPMSDCALYYGWYADRALGPFVDPLFRFVPGAVAVHIHSYSAATLRDPAGHWVGPLLAHGAAAALGNVYEPYLQLTTHLDILNDRLLHGFTLAESAYMSLPALSWMSVVVGDPLYRPYLSWLRLELEPESADRAAAWKMYHDFALRYGSLPEEEYRAKAREAATRAQNAPMLEDLGALAARANDHAAAAAHFQQARAIYKKRDDIVRATLQEAEAWLKAGNKKRSATLLKTVLSAIMPGPTEVLIRKKLEEIEPPPATPAKR